MALPERSGTSISLVKDAKEIKVINTNVSYARAFMFCIRVKSGQSA